MFSCERCGSRYNAMHAAALENCPRCQVRDQIAAPLTFKAFESIEFPQETDSKQRKPKSLPLTAASGRARRDRPELAPQGRRESLSQPG
jgi:hypothetical protein